MPGTDYDLEKGAGVRADYHVHTEFSDDSNYPLERVCADACRLGIDEICITDHVDYGVKYDVSPIDADGTIFDESYIPSVDEVPTRVWDGETILPINVDYQSYFPAVRSAAERWGSADHDWWGGRLTVRCGLELGVQKHTVERNRRLVEAHADELDFVLLSCHQIDDLEFWTGEFNEGKTPEEVTQRYYEEILASAEGMAGSYSCLAHLDAIKRDNLDPRPLDGYRDVVAAVLERAIADGCGIELNTSSVRYVVDDWQPCREILALYHDLGGRILTVGSDSHKPEHLGSYLSQAYALLESLGFEGICTFERRVPTLHRWSEVG